MSGIIEATNTIAAYSNAVLTLLLPRIIDTAHRLDLPEQNATMSEVRYCYPAQDARAIAERAVLEAEGSASAGELPSTAAGTVGFKTGNKYTFDFGYVVSFQTRHVFYGTEDLRRLARMYGKFVLTEAEAIAVARRAITKLGYSQKAMYTDLQPIVTVPGRSGTEVTPRFLIEWPKPNECYSPSAQFEINGETGAIECFFILNDTLFEPAPPIPGRKPAKGYHPELPESEARTLLPACFAPLGAFASRLKLPVALPITTNSVEKFAFYRVQGTVADITLTNGYFFKLFGLTPVEFNAPDVFFGSHHVTVKAFCGEWKMSQRDAISMARRYVRDFGLPTRWVASEPDIRLPYGPSSNTVPRCVLRWSPREKGAPGAISLEIDGNHRSITSFWVQ